MGIGIHTNYFRRKLERLKILCDFVWTIHTNQGGHSVVSTVIHFEILLSSPFAALSKRDSAM
jgi:hypothetical protein